MLQLDTATLSETLSGVLEAMTFVSPFQMSAAEALDQPPADPVFASIQFSGVVNGRLELVASESLGRLLAANLLGAEPTDEEAGANAEDVLKELMNVTCGSLIRRCRPDEAEQPQLGLPCLRKMPSDPGSWQVFLNQPGTVVMDADGHVVAARFTEADAA